MNSLIEFSTKRLRARQWQPSDWEAFAQLNADPRVMAFFPKLLSRAESDRLAERIQADIVKHGWGLWAIETLAESKHASHFIGFVGLNIPLAPLPFAPCVEIGWRLAFDHWGKGYATEMAQSALRIGFEQLGLDEIVSFTPTLNHRSRAVMEKLGMRQNTAEIFEHPNVPRGSPLRPHYLYRLQRWEWKKLNLGN